MRRTALIMGMPVTIEVVGFTNAKAAITDTFAYFKEVDERYSTYKHDSEISCINRGLPEEQWSDEMRSVLHLCEETKRATGGYFDIEQPNGTWDPSGLVKGWAIQHAAERLSRRGVQNFYVEAGGDLQTSGVNADGKPWQIGVRNPANKHEIVKTIALTDGGVATSGTYVRGQHIYNPHRRSQKLTGVQSITVVGTNIYDADRFATAAFAMGPSGITFIEALPGFEGYMIDSSQTATLTSGFDRYVAHV